MKYILTTIFSFLFLIGIFAQQPTDFYFKSPVPKQCTELKSTPAAYLGEWQSTKDTLRSFLVTENKIIARYKHVMIIPKKDFVSKGYKIEKGWVYGFTEKDSIPGVESNDTIILCYVNDHEIINFVKETGNEFLCEVKGGLILSRKEDSVYYYSLLTVKNNELTLSEVDHEPKLKDVIALTKPEAVKDEEGNVILYLADPDRKKMEKFISSGFFNEIQKCKRITE